MQAKRALESAAVGRPPVDKPRNVQIAFRINEEVADALDVELELERRPGFDISRNDVARMLMFEALAARQAARAKKRSK
jgi:hypothetical protein